MSHDPAPSTRRFPLVRRSALSALVLVAFTACGSSEDEGGELRTSQRGAAAGPDTVPAERVRDDLPARGHAWVIFGGDTVRAEVARTSEDRERGLMYREEVPEGTGMLFVFEDEEVRSFWMRNTYVPLDIAYMDAGMQIVSIKQMEPETDELYSSEAPAMFALEAPMGWFEDHGIEEGDRAEIVFGPR